MNNPWSKIKSRWKDSESIIRTLPWLINLGWRSGPRALTLWMVVVILEGLIPVAKLWVTKRIMDAVVLGIKSTSPATSIKSVLSFVLLELALTLLGHFLSKIEQVLNETVSKRATISINEQILRKSISLDISYFESPRFHDQLDIVLSVGAGSILETLYAVLSFLRTLVTINGVIILLLALNGWTAFVLLAVILPKLIIDYKFAKDKYQLEKEQASERRKSRDIFSILTRKEFAKEVKLFDFLSYLLQRWQYIVNRVRQQRLRLSKKSKVAGILAKSLSDLGYYGCYLYVVVNTLSKQLTLGDMYMYIHAFAKLQQQGHTIVDGLSSMYENHLDVKRLFSFLHLQPKIRCRMASTPPRFPNPIFQKIEFNGVSFRYKPDLPLVLKGVNLTIHPGECIAIVGSNGAGKTTLVKLLARIYDVTDGVISIDGIPLQNFELTDLRSNIGIIFQDYARYNFPAKENIGLGNISPFLNHDAIEEAAKKAGAHAFIERLPQGYETMLGTYFVQGVELSGGQWQKMALSRAFFRDAQILILDEPTASLDVMTEYEIFHNFQRLTQGKSAFLISHRFSTVRMADRIVVLDNGKITECGTHEELMQLGGQYAQMYTMQVKSYGLPSY